MCLFFIIDSFDWSLTHRGRTIEQDNWSTFFFYLSSMKVIIQWMMLRNQSIEWHGIHTLKKNSKNKIITISTQITTTHCLFFTWHLTLWKTSAQRILLLFFFTFARNSFFFRSFLKWFDCLFHFYWDVDFFFKYLLLIYTIAVKWNERHENVEHNFYFVLKINRKICIVKKK